MFTNRMRTPSHELVPKTRNKTRLRIWNKIKTNENKTIQGISKVANPRQRRQKFDAKYISTQIKPSFCQIVAKM